MFGAKNKSPNEVTVAKPTDDSWGTGSVVKTKPIGDRRWKPILFAYNRSVIGEAERPKLKAIYEYLMSNDKFDLLIEGHCDARGSEEYNRSLGERRAITVRDYLIKMGLPKSRIKTISYGEERPVVTGGTESEFRKNRRAELVVIAAKH